MGFGRDWLSHWPLDPTVTYLNHGTVGVTPRRVLEAQRQVCDQIERQPSRFLLRELRSHAFGRPRQEPSRLRVAAASVADFIGARADDLVFVDNVTTGVNAILRSFPFQPGDDMLLTDLGYGGIALAAQAVTRERGAVVRTVNAPYPCDGPALIEALVAAVGPRTRLAIVDHITAESALVLPLSEAASRLRSLGVAVLADGAHAPGAIPLDVPSLGVDWYVGNLHKWAWAPRSSALLWAAPERQSTLHPAVLGWQLDQGFAAEFDVPDTRDPSPHLTAPTALALFDEWGRDAVQGYNHALAWSGAQVWPPAGRRRLRRPRP